MTSAATHPTKRGRNRLRARPLLPLISGAVVIGVMIAGCGTSSSTGSALGPLEAQTRAQYLGYAGCMRSHGVPGYPDPGFSGSAGDLQVQISPGSANPNSPAFKSADRACHYRLPNGGVQGGPGGSGAPQQAQDVLFADCMRSHGVPSFPDPDRDGTFTLPATSNEQAPAFLHATHACEKVQPSSLSIYQGS